MDEVRTFTQEQIDEIVKERVAREKVKYEALHREHEKLQADLATAQGELKAAQDGIKELPILKRNLLVQEVAQAKNVPAALVVRLVGDTKEALEKDADALLKDLVPVKPANRTGVPLTPLGGGEPAPTSARARIAKIMRENKASTNK
jgi:seryl-tRNA synthetase